MSTDPSWRTISEPTTTQAEALCLAAELWFERVTFGFGTSGLEVSYRYHPTPELEARVDRHARTLACAIPWCVPSKFSSKRDERGVWVAFDVVYPSACCMGWN